MCRNDFWHDVSESALWHSLSSITSNESRMNELFIIDICAFSFLVSLTECHEWYLSHWPWLWLSQWLSQWESSPDSA